MLSLNLFHFHVYTLTDDAMLFSQTKNFNRKANKLNNKANNTCVYVLRKTIDHDFASYFAASLKLQQINNHFNKVFYMYRNCQL